jgi:hypothetical protein
MPLGTPAVEWGLFAGKEFKPGHILFDQVAEFDVVHNIFLRKMKLVDVKSSSSNKLQPAHIYHFISLDGLINTDDVGGKDNQGCLWAYVAESACWYINSALASDGTLPNVAFDVYKKKMSGRGSCFFLRVKVIRPITAGDQILESYMSEDTNHCRVVQSPGGARGGVSTKDSKRRRKKL